MLPRLGRLNRAVAVICLVVQDLVEDITSEFARQWAPAYENDTLRPRDLRNRSVIAL